MEAVTERVRAQLERIEAEQSVGIVYAVESGSRAWGFASEDSDYDVRFIYVRGVKEYLRVVPRRDVIERPITDALDINGWDLFKALALFRKSNPPLLEWLFSPIIYREQGDLAAKLRALASTHVSLKRMTYHYLSMAKGNYRDYIVGKPEVVLKKYLYAMRPLICIRWMEQHGSPPPTSLPSALIGTELAPSVAEALQQLLARKRQGGELGADAALATLNDFIEGEIERISVLVAELPDPLIEERRLNELAWTQLNL